MISVDRFLRYLALGAILLLVGCSTIPSRTSADDCLVVIKVVSLNETGIKGRQYSFTLLSDVPRYSKYRLPEVTYFAAFVIREPNVSICAVNSELPTGDIGKPSSDPVNVPLPYSPGHMVIANVVFVTQMKETSPHHFLTQASFRTITENEREDLKTLVASDGASQGWLTGDEAR